MDVRQSSSACPFRFASPVRPISISYSDIDDHGCSILSKLKAETNQLTGVALNGKKATVDTHRGGKTRLLRKTLLLNSFEMQIPTSFATLFVEQSNIRWL